METIVLNDTVSTIPRGQKELKLRPFANPQKLKIEREAAITKLDLE